MDSVIDLLFPYPYFLIGLIAARLAVWYGNRKDWYVTEYQTYSCITCTDKGLGPKWTPYFCGPSGHRLATDKTYEYQKGEALSAAVMSAMFWPAFFLYVFLFWKQPESPALLKQRIKELESELNL